MQTLAEFDIGCEYRTADEFSALLRQHGATPRHYGQHTIRCPWHDDRTPSLSINPTKGVFRCHSAACGVSGGIGTLRKMSGIEIGPNAAQLDRLRRLATPGVDLLRLLHPDVLAQFRSKAGRHKRDAVLIDNLRRIFAAIFDTMTNRERTMNVPFTANDASRYGIPSGLWQHFVTLQLTHNGKTQPLIAWFGIDVRRGESGRCVRRGFRGTGKNGAFRATELSLVSVCAYPRSMEEGSSISQTSPRRDMHKTDRHPIETVLRASVASSRPRGSVPTLARRPAVALLLANLDSVEIERAPGVHVRPGSLTVGELVRIYGPRIRRTIRAARREGWVKAVFYRGDGLVWITDDGAKRLSLDRVAGHRYLNDRADRIAAAWSERQGKNRAECTTHARKIALGSIGGTSSPWVSIEPGRVRHADTGEIRTLAEIRAARG